MIKYFLNQFLDGRVLHQCYSEPNILKYAPDSLGEITYEIANEAALYSRKHTLQYML